MNTVENKRNYGLDIMRILSMTGIVILHILGNGGVLNSCKPDTVNYWVSYFIEICALCSVNLFGLLTGYLCYNRKKHSCFRALSLMSTVLFYCLVISLVFCIFFREYVGGIKGLINSVFPVTQGYYWYITCYIALFFVIPYINILLSAISERQHGKLCMILIVLFSVIPSLLNIDLFKTFNGYSTAWLIICYIIGAYMSRSGKKLFKKAEIPVFFGSALLVLAIRFVTVSLLHTDKSYFSQYTSVLILLCAVMLLQWAAGLNTGHMPKYIKSSVKYISCFAFDVYAIHCHILIFQYVLANSFSRISGQFFLLIPLSVIGCAAGIYLVCFAASQIKQLVFKLCRIDNIISIISAKLDKCLGWDSES